MTIFEQQDRAESSTNPQDSELMGKMFNQMANSVIFSRTSIQLDFFLEPMLSPHAGYYKECRLKTPLYWLYLSNQVLLG